MNISAVVLGCMVALILIAIFGFFIVAYESQRIRKGVMDEEAAFKFIEESRSIIQGINSDIILASNIDDGNYSKHQVEVLRMCQRRYELLSRLTLEEVMHRKSFDLRDYFSLNDWKILLNIQ